MDFLDVINRDSIYIGHKDKILKEIDFESNPSLVITGETGTGKSILLDQIILQFINKYTSLEMGILCIDTSGVELSKYAESKYSLISAINDENKSIVVLSRILREIERRKKLLKENNCLSVKEYNKKNDSNKLPLLLVAIDDDKLLLRNEDIEKIIAGILENIKDLGIYFILSTSDVYNKFFERDLNTMAATLVSFDYVSEEDSIRNNIENSSNLGIGEFYMKIGCKVSKLHNFEFDDSYIDKILERV